MALIAHTFANPSGDTATTGSLDTTGANLLIVAVAYGDVGADPTVSDNKSNTWTGLTKGGIAAFVRLYYCYGATVGSGHTFSAQLASSSPSIEVIAWAGAASSPFDQQNGNDAASSTTCTTGSVTPTQDNEILFAACQAGNGASSIDTGFTISDQSTGGYLGALAYFEQGTAAAINPTWSQTPANHFATAIASFKQLAVTPKALTTTPLVTVTTLSTLVNRVKALTTTPLVTLATLARSHTYLQALTTTPLVTVATLERLRRLLKALTTTPTVTVATLTHAFLPIISAVVPASDRTTGGQAIIVLGSHFQNGATVTIGGTAATSVVFVSATRLTCVAPAHAAGVVDIVVTNPDATTSTDTGAFTYYTPAANDITLVSQISGVSPFILYGSLGVSLSSSRGDASFDITYEGTRPIPFAPIKLGFGSLADRDLFFKGAIELSTQLYTGSTANRHWTARAIDSSVRFNRHLVWGVYIGWTADAIGRDLLKFAPEFTGAGIADNLDIIPILVFNGESMDSAFNQIATAIGGYCYRTLFDDVHLFVTETVIDTPDPLDSNVTTLERDPPIFWSADTSQVRNRVIGVGAQARAFACPVGETILPIDSAGMFEDAGTVLIQGQRIVHTGRQIGYGGSLVGPGVAPSVAPTVTPIAGAGLSVGSYSWAYVFGTAAGKSLPGPLNTLAFSNVTPPTVAPTNHALVAGGNINYSGSYEWVYTWVTATGESGPSPISGSSSTTAVNKKEVLTEVAVGPAGTLSRNVYRRVNGAGAFKLAVVVPNNTTTEVADTLANADLGKDVPAAGIYQAGLTAIAIGPTGTTYREVYRTIANGSQLKLQQTIANNTATAGVTDATADGSLGGNAPTSDTSGLAQVTGQINAGSTSIVTASAGPFEAAGGWAGSGSGQIIRYTGITGNTLTGVPATGPGAIATTLPYGSAIIPIASLTGIPATGTGAIVSPVLVNENVSLYTERNDTASQAAIKAIEGGKSTGIYDFKIVDSSLTTQIALNVRCDADLFVYAKIDGIISVTYTSRDFKSRVGRLISINLPEIGLIGDFIIQTVNINPNGIPLYTCTASSIRFSLEDILRHVVMNPR